MFFSNRFLTGQVDKRTLEKYEREAREKNRETWYLSWALDTNQEERDKVSSLGLVLDVMTGWDMVASHRHPKMWSLEEVQRHPDPRG